MEFKEYLISKGVTEEQAAEIVGGMPEKEFHLTKEEKLDERYAKLKQQKEDVDAQLETANTTIEDLKNSNKSNEDLQTKVTEYEGQIETLKEQSADIQKQSAIELSLVKNGARNPKAVKGLLDVEKVELTDEGVKGLEEQLEALKESDAYLFQTKDDDRNPHIQSGEDPNGQSQDDTDAFEEATNKFI
jgi:predicted RNase H-like nuclease (RuvC/YqgF family)